MSRYYEDNRRWVRRLLMLDGLAGKRYFDISLTGDNLPLLREERIRIHRTTDGLKEFHDELPAPVVLEMNMLLGEELASKLRFHNYIDALGLENILKANKANTETHGLPAGKVVELALGRQDTLWGQELNGGK